MLSKILWFPYCLSMHQIVKNLTVSQNHTCNCLYVYPLLNPYFGDGLRSGYCERNKISFNFTIIKWHIKIFMREKNDYLFGGNFLLWWLKSPLCAYCFHDFNCLCCRK